jgi:sugar lactone lactonase YvrE
MSRHLAATLLCCTLAWLSPSSARALDTVIVLAPGEIPESVTMDATGTLYFSVGGSVRRRTPGGEISVFGTLPIAEFAFALGVKVGPDGCVYTASTSLSPNPGAFVWRICTPGNVEQIAALDPTGGPNDLAFDRDGNLFVTDPFLGQIWAIDRNGAARVWLADALLKGNAAAPALLFHVQGVNGIAFDKHHRNLYVGNLDYGRIVRIPVRADGTAGCPAVFAQSPLLVGADGIAFDRKGNLLVAVNAQDRLALVDPHGAVTSLSQGALLDAPSSIVFDTSADRGRQFFLTSSAFSRTLQLVTGTPRPALLSGEGPHPGLPLP